MVQSEVLFQVLDALDSLGIPYMVTGPFASNFWGRPRFTHDADLVVEARQGPRRRPIFFVEVRRQAILG